MVFLQVSFQVPPGVCLGFWEMQIHPAASPPLHPSQFELEKLCVLCWRELSTAATIIWADSTPPSANRSPSGQSPKLPHPAGSFRKQGSGWIPVRGLNREAEEWAESRGWGGQERRL